MSHSKKNPFFRQLFELFSRKETPPTPPPPKKVAPELPPKPEPTKKKSPPPNISHPKPPPKIKRKSSAKKSPPLDKKGFRILSNNDDLYAIFGEERHQEYRSITQKQDNEFERLFKESQTDFYQMRLMQDKKESPTRPAPSPITIAERVKNYPPPKSELDLHGFTSVQAERQTESFIKKSRDRGVKTVRIIVGKGTHSQGKAILPDVVAAKVIELKRTGWVLAYKWEKKDKFKSGALIVYLMT
jgi:DNA-nicking Smr family endonuclease